MFLHKYHVHASKLLIACASSGCAVVVIILVVAYVLCKGFACFSMGLRSFFAFTNEHRHNQSAITRMEGHSMYMCLVQVSEREEARKTREGNRPTLARNVNSWLCLSQACQYFRENYQVRILVALEECDESYIFNQGFVVLCCSFVSVPLFCADPSA